MRIVWVSRHELNEKNHEILKKAFGEYEVVQYKETVKDVAELLDFARNVMADALIVVLPPNILQELIQKKGSISVYRFTVERIVKEDGSVKFIPTGLEEIVEIKIVTRRVV